MTDADRERFAVQNGARMFGPKERQRCAQHPRRWEIYRWTWKLGTGPEFGEPEMLRGCADCAEVVE